MTPDEEAARQLVSTVAFYTAEVQAERRSFVRRKALVASELLADAATSADPDEMAALVMAANQAVLEAVAEILQASLL